MKRQLMLVAAALVIMSGVSVATAEPPDANVTVVFDHALPNVPGKSMKGILLEYPAGGSSPAHSHAASAFIYATVLEGVIRSKVNDGPEKLYRKGESFFEMPGDHHAVSANGSATRPAKLLAVFVVNTDERVLTTPLSHR